MQNQIQIILANEIMPRLSSYSRGLVIFITITIGFLTLYNVLLISGGKSTVTAKLKENITVPLHFVLEEKNSINYYQSLQDNWRNLTHEQMGKMSTLGKWLLSPEGTDVPKRDPDRANPQKEYRILIWKYGPMLERRHLKHFTDETFSPWEDCSVKNCRLSYESGDLEKADAVLFHLHRTRGPQDLPKNLKFKNRVRQRWIFLTDESPFHTFLFGNQQLENYNGIFNWSMTYRMDSDVPVPYGRTVRAKSPGNSHELDENLMKTKSKLVAIMGSNCGGKNHRWDYIRKLKEILADKLDIYGICLGGDTKTCPGHFTKDCAPLGAYKFYLAFENSNCKEYLTEKPYWHGYGKNSVPVIMGASRENCRQLLPPGSYLHVDDFSTANTLADYLLYLDRNDDRYLKFHEWRSAFKVLNEHGYFQSVSRHYCRICEALNYNEPSIKVYDNLEDFWNPRKDCSL